ncbi:hypothetical protein [Flavobacterium aquiphilum]|uniref:hypothetical protein n=1 Tax=Flavobacterium aquiphilum TaxID=3003261 RepID=UPI002480ACE9|nr:hypothetical protein [Flavobacterium aquiphilum]
MSKKSTNTSAVSVDVLKSNFETAEAALNAITETASVEEKEAAQKVFDDAKLALDSLTDISTPEDKETIQTTFETAESALNAIKDLPTPEEKQAAQTAFDEAKLAYETALKPNTGSTTSKPKDKMLKGKFIVSPTGRFNLGYNVGEEAEFPELQARELDEAGYFKIDNNA